MGELSVRVIGVVTAVARRAAAQVMVVRSVELWTDDRREAQLIEYTDIGVAEVDLDL